MNKNLGQLTIDLVAKIGGWTQGLSKAERELDTRTKRMNKMANDFGKSLGIGLAAGVGVASTALGIYIRNTIEAEKVQSQLASRIKDTGGAAGKSVADLNKVSAALQNLTTFDDESIGRVQAMLLTFRNIKGDNFDSATKAVLNLSTAMGTDLNSAALQVGKALNDPIAGISALSRAGVQFSEDQKKAIKALVETGDAAGAQQIILRELQGEMGTAAEAARNTLGGALEALKNSFDNLLEGDSGDAGVKGARSAIESLITTMNDPDVHAGVQSIVTGIANIAQEAANAIPDLVAFNAKLSEAFGLSGNGATRNANAADFGAGFTKGVSALLHGRLKEAQAMADRAYAGFFGGTVANFGNVKGAVDGNRPDFGNVSGLIDGGRGSGATGGATGGGSKGGGKSAVSKQVDDLKALIAAQDDYHKHLLDMAADLAGPVAQINRDYEKQLQELNDAYAAGKVRQEDFAKAQELLTQKRDADLKQIRDDAQHQWDGLIAQMNGPLADAEQAHIERLKEIQKLGEGSGQTADAIAAAQATETAAYNRATEAIKAQMDALANPEVVEVMDTFRRSFTDNLTALVTGAESATDAIKNFLDDIAESITRAIAQNWGKQLFGDYGTTGSGSGGGWLSSLLGAFFSSGSIGVTPGAASGGWRPGDSLFAVNERGFEMASVGGRDYLLAGPNPVEITPHNALTGPGMTQNFNFALAAPTDPRTQAQIAQRAAFETRRAQARNS